MISNKHISDSINQWSIEYDPYGFAKEELWLEGAELTGDILQLQHIYDNGPVLDVGWYDGVYRAVVIIDKDWENPIEVIESTGTSKITKALYSWLTKYENGA